MTKVLSVQEVAERLAIKPATVRKMLFQRRIPRGKIGGNIRLRRRILRC